MKQAYVDDCPYYLDDFLTNMKVVKDRSDRTEEAYFFPSKKLGGSSYLSAQLRYTSHFIPRHRRHANPEAAACRTRQAQKIDGHF